MLPILRLFYFLFIMPQQQQEKKRRAMIDALKKNDKVLTTGGIYGTVMSVDAKNDKVVLRVDDERGVKLAFTKASVARVLESSAEKSSGIHLMSTPRADRPIAAFIDHDGINCLERPLVRDLVRPAAGIGRHRTPGLEKRP